MNKRLTATPLGMVLLLSLALMFAAACPVQAQSSDPQETLQQYISDLQKKPNDDALRDKIIKLAQEMTPAPAIPAEAKKFGNRAEYAVKNAKSDADLTDAIKEYEKALLIAPWVATYYYNLGAVCEKTGQVQSAMRNYTLYLLAAPNAQDTQEVQKQIDGLEYALEKADKAAKINKEKEAASKALIPAGEIIMKGNPPRKVFLNAYYIDKYEVTVAQYLKFCQASGHTMPRQPAWSTDKHPVVNVSWEDAAAYANYYGKRLPTEAEWEKAARAGSTTKYFFGDADSELGTYAWYRDNSGGQAHPVGLKKPNVFGLYDIYGNVSEWCADLLGESHVLRGGRYIDYASICDYTYGGIGGGDDRGFRCVSSP